MCGEPSLLPTALQHGIEVVPFCVVIVVVEAVDRDGIVTAAASAGAASTIDVLCRDAAHALVAGIQAGRKQSAGSVSSGRGGVKFKINGDV